MANIIIEIYIYKISFIPFVKEIKKISRFPFHIYHCVILMLALIRVLDTSLLVSRVCKLQLPKNMKPSPLKPRADTVPWKMCHLTSWVSHKSKFCFINYIMYFVKYIKMIYLNIFSPLDRAGFLGLLASCLYVQMLVILSM